MPEAPRRRAAARGEARRPASRPSRAESSERHTAGAEDRDDAARSDRHSESISDRAVPVRQLVASARGQLEEMIGRPVSAVLGFEPNENGWQITLEVVELERIPDTTSILGCYRAYLDEDGELTEYRRIRRYNRSQPDEDH
ncbi:MAG TPA: gas vesicle protein [Solirubrobacteraceae bacterium]|nr:gas vesicle protein [Solirubrobacteraceae bacterium]